MAFTKVTIWKADIAGVNYGTFYTEDDAIAFIRTFVTDDSWWVNDVRVFAATIIEEDE